MRGIAHANSERGCSGDYRSRPQRRNLRRACPEIEHFWQRYSRKEVGVDTAKRAATAARQDADFKIIARTDARTSEGIDAAIERINRYREAGADILFVESPESEAELERVIREAPGAHVANMVEGGRTPFLGVDSLRRLGFRVVIFPNSLTRLFARMGSEMLGELGRTGTTTAYRDRMLDHRQLWDLFDNSGWVALADKFEKPAPNT
jgi:2-methylisocitrate lyase-like PEP mutase family enzyme